MQSLNVRPEEKRLVIEAKFWWWVGRGGITEKRFIVSFPSLCKRAVS